MMKGEKNRVKSGGGDIDENTLREKADESPESDFFLSTQNIGIDEEVKKEEIIKQTKGEVKIDKSTGFFLSEFPLSDEENE